MTAGFAVGGARADHRAAHQASTASAPTQVAPQDPLGAGVDPSQGQGGFAPPSASNSPPQAMSGGS